MFIRMWGQPSVFLQSQPSDFNLQPKLKTLLTKAVILNQGNFAIATQETLTAIWMYNRHN